MPKFLGQESGFILVIKNVDKPSWIEGKNPSLCIAHLQYNLKFPTQTIYHVK